MRAPVLVVGTGAWRDGAAGSNGAGPGRLAPARRRRTWPSLRAGDGATTCSRRPAWWWARRRRGAGRHPRARSPHRPADQRALVPALVVGDDAGLDPDLRGRLPHDRADPPARRLGHQPHPGRGLPAGRWRGGPGSGAAALVRRGASGIVGLRAAGARRSRACSGRRRWARSRWSGWAPTGASAGRRALGVAVVGAAAARPGLAGAVGLRAVGAGDGGHPAPRAGLARRAARAGCRGWVAEAVAVPVAAQLACTPVVAAISGQVSLVAVAGQPAGRARWSARRPCSGLAGGLLGAGLGAARARSLGTLAGWCVAWIVRGRRSGARRCPPRRVGWSSGALCPGGADRAVRAWSPADRAAAAPARRRARLARCSLPWSPCWCRPPTPGLAAAGLGAGRLRRRAGRRAGAQRRAGRRGRRRRRSGPARGGPVPAPARGRRVPLLVLTHFHADHVDGLPGVLSGRQVGEVEVTGCRPAGRRRRRSRRPRRRACAARAPYGEAPAVGRGRPQVLWPPPGAGDGPRRAAAPPTTPASCCWSRSRGVRILLTGDVEPEAQAALARACPALDGRRAQGAAPRQPLPGPRLPAGPRRAGRVVSVGADNDYGHPAAATLRRRSPTPASSVLRTDRDGDSPWSARRRAA